jgi:hypothetical protein
MLLQSFYTLPLLLSAGMGQGLVDHMTFLRCLRGPLDPPLRSMCPSVLLVFKVLTIPMSGKLSDSSELLGHFNGELIP